MKFFSHAETDSQKVKRKFRRQQVAEENAVISPTINLPDTQSYGDAMDINEVIKIHLSDYFVLVIKIASLNCSRHLL